MKRSYVRLNRWALITLVMSYINREGSEQLSGQKHELNHAPHSAPPQSEPPSRRVEVAL